MGLMVQDSSLEKQDKKQLKKIKNRNSGIKNRNSTILHLVIRKAQLTFAVVEPVDAEENEAVSVDGKIPALNLTIPVYSNRMD